MVSDSVRRKRGANCGGGGLGRAARWFCVLVCVAGWVVCAGSAVAGLRVCYVRHGESGQNVEKDWRDKPKESWPVYVGNMNMFSPLGEKQVAALTERLAGREFDFIAVSPMWRARNTILPYLRATNRKAEVWPELTEIDAAAAGEAPATLPAASADLFAPGRAVELPAEEEEFFTLRPDGRLLYDFKLGDGEPLREANRRAIAGRIMAMVEERFGGTDKTVLLVGHGTAGYHLLRGYVGGNMPKGPGIKNTAMWMVEEQGDGTFKLLLYNNAPYGPASAEGK